MDPIEKVGHGMTYGGGTTAVLFGMDANTLGVIAGVVIGILGLLITWYFQRRRDQREQAEHAARMKGFNG